jgi:hypothetical protein
VVGKKHKDEVEGPVDLAARIGMPSAARPAMAAPELVRRVDAPIEPGRHARRAILIGANEQRPAGHVESREPERPAPIPGRPGMIGLEEAVARHAPAGTARPEPVPPAAFVSPAALPSREAPAAGEMDLVVTPLPTPDDWHHFELALRRVPGVGPLRTEYYRAGILKLRLRWTGTERFADAVAAVPGYRVGILGEDRSTVQIRVVRA